MKKFEDYNAKFPEYLACVKQSEDAALELANALMKQKEVKIKLQHLQKLNNKEEGEI